jgi:hypothetical protein
MPSGACWCVLQAVSSTFDLIAMAASPSIVLSIKLER